ncbi:MAG: hypothetical protein DHS20C12_07850 [Pseudohongiella sp.]|nr:MAG: hypothetical protein DHS20C12_07850 [Pseudohongiella sp.]
MPSISWFKFSLLLLCCVEQSDIQAADCPLEQVAKFPFEIYVGCAERRYLAELIAKTQEEYFERYNEINVEDRYDVYCYRFPNLVRKLAVRFCGTPQWIIRRGDGLSALVYKNTTLQDRNLIQGKKHSPVRRGAEQTQAPLEAEMEALRLRIARITSSDKRLSEMETVFLFLMSEKAP